MKKNRTIEPARFNYLKKLCLGICLVFCTANLLNAAPSTYSEQTTLTVKMNNKTVKDVFNYIESNSEFIFIYQADNADLNRKVSVNMSGTTVNRILDQVFENTSMTYTIIDRQIIVKQQESAAATTVQQQSPQRRTISGTVTDKNGPVVGAMVMVKENTTIGTVTGNDGKYTLSVPENSTLVFSHLGYRGTEEIIGTRTTIDVALMEDFEVLDEVVVVGFARQKKANLTGAVSSIAMDEVAGVRPATATATLLQGVVPGLQVTSGSGEPGGGFSLNIRGTTSITGGSPLILVDNVPFTGPLNLLNPDDIESVSVLKDGGSAAIYGARGAYGVVLITTKSAKKGEPLKISYTANFAFSTPSQLPDKASPLQTVQAYKDAGYVNNHRGRDTEKWLEYLRDYRLHPSDYPLGYVMDNDVRYPLQKYDQIRDFLAETGFQQIHNASVSGSSARSSYRMSLGYTDSDGVMVTNRDYYNKVNARGFLNSQITNWLSGQLDMNFYKSDKGMPNNADYSSAVALPSFTPLGTVAYDGTDYYIGTPANLAKLGGTNKTGYSDTRMTGKLIATPVKDLVINGEFTYESLNQTIKNYAKRFSYAGPYDLDVTESRSSSSLTNTKQVTEQTTLNLYGAYDKSFAGKHNFTLLAGYNQEAIHRDSLSVTRADMINDEMPAINTATGTPTVGETIKEYSLMGFFGRLMYNYKERYFIELNGRYDGSSKFPSDQRWGFFPSVSVAWRVTKEPFMKRIHNFMPEFKIRASYATLGNQNINPYEFVPDMDSYYPTWLVGNEKILSLYSPGLVRSNFTWETIETYNIGLDAAFFKGRLNLVFDLYERNTRDMLAPGFDLPAVVGASAPLQNSADLRSRGFELDVKWRDRIGKVSYYLGVNLYDYRSEITKYNSNDGFAIFNSDGTNAYYKGYQMGTIWGYTSERYYTESDFDNGNLRDGIARPAGINPKPGDILFVNYDDNGIIDNGSGTVDKPGDIRIIGNNSLRFQYGINGGVNWKNFDFSFFIEGVGKRDIYLSNELIFPMYYEFGGIFSHQLNYWTPENPQAHFPRLYEQGTKNPNYTSNIRRQTKYLQNGAYLRVKNMTLSYTIPGKITTRWGISSLRIFSSVENPFMFDHLPEGVDPTLDNKGRGLGYPVMRIVSFGLSMDL